MTNEITDQPSSAEAPYARLMRMSRTDAQLEALLPDPAVSLSLKAPHLVGADIITRVFEGYAERPAMGERAYKLFTCADGRHTRHYEGRFDTISYATLRHRVESLASCWRADPDFVVKPDEFVCTLGFTGIGLAVVDLAALHAQTVIVPLQANQPLEQLLRIIGETRPAMIVATLDNLALAVSLAEQASGWRSIAVLDYDPRCDDERSAFAEAQSRLAEIGCAIAVAPIEELIDRGAALGWVALPRAAEGPERISSLLFTSGSTGTPKGAMIPERITNRFWTSIKQPQPSVTLAYAPLNHHFGRNMIYGTLAQGGTVFFTLKSDMSTLFDDIRLARPTSFAFIPRVIDIIFDRYKADVARRAAHHPELAIEAVQVDVQSEMRESFLGGRLVAGSVGTAPVGHDAKAFMRVCFGIPLIEGYGSTECGGVVAIEGKIAREFVIDYKLRDVPELNYRSTDKPFPRGELLVLSRLQIPGYFNRPDADATLFDERGYIATGDIVEERGPDHVIWIDRKNNVLKLAHGEYVAISTLESGFEGASPLVDQIYVYGNARYAFLVAVVVPNMAALQQQLGPNVSDGAIKAAILTSLQQTGREQGLKAFEVPRDILVERDPFSVTNGLLSSVLKPLRPKLKEKYGARLEALYEEIVERQAQGFAASAVADGASVVARITSMVAALLGIEAIDTSKRQSFGDLSGDSLSAVSLSLSIEEAFGVHIPVGTLLDPTGSIAQWADMIDNTQGNTTPSFAGIHVDVPEGLVHAGDLTLPRFLGEEWSPTVSAEPVGKIANVLLTGANGHLGHILCLSWLKRVAARGGQLVCLVRSPDDAAATKRLSAMFDGADPALSAEFHGLARDHLQVLAGDLTKPWLGLSEERYTALADTVDAVVHPAALVNHMLAYRDLFHPNVVGTAELIRFALVGRRKAFHFISSVAVPRLSQAGVLPAEIEDVRAVLPTVRLSDSYASGYGTSKWAGEVLLRDANERFGLDVAVFRGDMMLTDRRFRGQINTDDMFSRLLLSVALSGVAPSSFYEKTAEGARPKAHYDGMAVDYMADAITVIGDGHPGGYASYNVSNYHHNDGVSLDVVVDWIEGAGYAVDRLDGHDTWLKAFQKRMADLPETARQRSILPIIMAYEKPQSPHPKPLPSEAFEAVVATLGDLPPVPHIDAALVQKSLADLELLGLLPGSDFVPARSETVGVEA